MVLDVFLGMVPIVGMALWYGALGKTWLHVAVQTVRIAFSTVASKNPAQH